ncbi:hypothetical protein [Streptomyces sp. NPDC050164]|uniref:hypothetical protein n=1 Tax=Streptomyces sp. NPDC050164 TaxID=3365605 RepID=UPI0037B05568
MPRTSCLVSAPAHAVRVEPGPQAERPAVLEEFGRGRQGVDVLLRLGEDTATGQDTHHAAQGVRGPGEVGQCGVARGDVLGGQGKYGMGAGEWEETCEKLRSVAPHLRRSPDAPPAQPR